MLVHYKIKYFDECEKPKFIKRIANGITFGKTIGDATDRAINWYGKENVISIEVYQCEDILDNYDFAELLKDEDKEELI